MTACPPRPIGLLSGLGPLAGEDVLRRILEYAAERYGAVEDAEYPDVVLLSHGIEDFDATGDVTHGFGPALAAMVDEIEPHHPVVIGIACNTAHLFLDELRPRTAAPIVDLVDEVARAAARRAPARFLVLSSSTTRATGLYGAALRRHGVDFAEVSPIDQLAVDDVVHLVMAHQLDDAGKAIAHIVDNWRDRPFDALLAGCTELPIALAAADLARAVPIVDSNQVLAEVLTDAYYRGAERVGT